MRGVRLTEIGWEGQCDKCRSWWPLDTENWKPRTGLRQCYACIKERSRAALAQLRRDNPEMRERHRAASRENQAEKRRVDRDSYLEYQRRWYAAHHVKLNAERAELHAIRAELEGREIRRTSRDETPETLAIRTAFRRAWIAENGPLVTGPTLTSDEELARRRAYQTEWMRRKRAKARKAEGRGRYARRAA
jgi:hypothetical protein